MNLALSNDRKVANLVTKGGNPAIQNTFGLPSGISCPNQTAFCETICYAGKIEGQYATVHNKLMDNYLILARMSKGEMTHHIGAMIQTFATKSDKRSAPKLFRIHWDGDFFSVAYAEAWANVVMRFTDVTFWVYTRTPEIAEYLHNLRLHNLSVYFSADPDNVDMAKDLSAKGIHIAYVDMTFAQGKAEFPKAVRCPENNKAITLIDADKGSACVRCGYCVFGRGDVLFSVSKS